MNKNVNEVENSQIDDESEDDVEIVEDENGQCTVRIKPKPIKLKIINLHAAQSPGTSNKALQQSKKRKMSDAMEGNTSTNGHLNHQSQFELDSPELVSASKRPRKNSAESTEDRLKAGRPKTPQDRDVRTHCDKVG